MAGQTNTAYDAVLKDFYEGPVREHIENKVTILKLTEKSKELEIKFIELKTKYESTPKKD